jgi:hypothetical protein
LPRRLGDPKPYFYAGQRVVCVNAVPNPLAPRCKPLVAGKIYVIRAIDVDGEWKWPWWGVHLEGIFIFHPDGHGEWAFHPGRFRAVTDRVTDITIFKELAAAVMANAPLPPAAATKVQPDRGPDAA